MAERESGFYWVRVGDEWTVGEWTDGRWYIVGDECSWGEPGSEERMTGESGKLAEIGPLIPPRKIPAAQKAGAK
jgi:hypothetical protein